MFGKADLERWYRNFFWVILVLIFVLFSSLYALADEVKPNTPIHKQEISLEAWPVTCMTSHLFKENITKGQYFALWQGLSNNIYLTTLWNRVGSKDWVISIQMAGNDLICILSSGNESGQLGEDS